MRTIARMVLRQHVSLVLKRREQEQADLQSFELLRVPRIHEETVRSGQGQRSLIYVPRDGYPSMRHAEGHYIAEAIIDSWQIDPDDPSMLILRLADIRRFQHFVPYSVDGRPFETADYYRFRDRSIEQKAVRAISPKDLQQILTFSRIDTSTYTDDLTDDEAVATPIKPELVAPASLVASAGFREPNFSEIKTAERARAHTSSRVRSRYVRLKCRSLDRHTCTLTGTFLTLDDQPIAVEVAHIHGMGCRGEDWLTNVILLCLMAHKLLDRLAFTLHDDLRVLWSRHVNPHHYGLNPHADNRLHLERPDEFMPALKNIRWHRQRFMQKEAERDAKKKLAFSR